MRYYIGYLTVLAFISLPAKADDYFLGIGETARLKTSALQSLIVEKKGILSINDMGTSLVFTGKKLGSTRVSFGSNHHQFHVLHKKDRKTQTHLQEWLKGKRGPKISVQDAKVFIGGRFLRHEDFQDLNNFCGEKCNYKVTATPYPQAQTEIKNYVTNLLAKHNLPAGELVFEPHWSIRLNAKHKKLKSRIVKVLNPYGIYPTFDSNDIAQVPVIRIQVFIAHVKKSFMRTWGISWPSEATATLLAGQDLNLNPINVSLKALESQGQGQLLASPTLITESNKQAEFHSGGEFPITTTTQFNNSVQWKRYGLFLKTTPVANSQGSLKIHIDLEMSTLDQSFSNSEVPALIRSNVKTQVNMAKPQPILLSGFLRQDRGNNLSGLPWLQQIPIFKPLFSTGNVYDSELELVFILIPSFYEH